MMPSNSNPLPTKSTTSANLTTTEQTTAQRTKTATNLSSVSTRNSTIFYFKRHGTDQAKLRLSLQNISGNALHYKFKKATGTKLKLEPLSYGVIEKQSSTTMTITWDYADARRNSGGPYAKMILEVALNDTFTEASSTRLVVRLSALQFDPAAKADVLIVDSPAKQLTAKQSITSANSSPSLGTRSESSTNTAFLHDLEQKERQQLRQWLLLYFLLIILLAFVYQIYNTNKQIDTNVKYQMPNQQLSGRK